MERENYTEKELYNMLWEKAEELEKVPTAREINSDHKLPNYKIFVECFGQFRKSKKLKELVKKFKLINRMNKTFCHDCYNEKCKGNFKSCKNSEAAEVYFELFDTIIH